ncbi:MAG: hypothetical protein JWM59_3286 [Verrucomicrobiales bacterium]|nr:hypothetical protein [Verrucomicrobiales bacterium]
MFTDLDILPEFITGPPDDLITAAAEKFVADSRIDQFGAVRPEPRLCFLSGPSVVLRDAWGEILGRVAITEITPQTI